MPGTVVVYKTKYGATKKYAEWIAKALQADLFDASDLSADKLQHYDTIIYGGGLYAGGINGFSFIKKEFDRIKDKKLVLFTVGLANPKDTGQFQPIIDRSLTEEMKRAIKVFHFRGSMDYGELGLLHRAGMSFMKGQVARKGEKDKNEEDRLLLETYGKSVDFTDEASIAPLIGYCREP